MTLRQINKISGILLLLLTITVSIPLTIMTIKTHGGSWGFGMIGLPLLLPLNCYLLFALAALLKKEENQRKGFMLSHLVTLSVGLIAYFLMPLYPKGILLIPVLLAIFGIFDKARLYYYLLAMILLAIIANALLLKWEFEFHRTVPILQLFQSTENINSESAALPDSIFMSDTSFGLLAGL